MTGNNLAIPGVVDAVEIGRGGFGVVYRATEVELGREVAVKVLTGELDERTRTRFERERRAMGALSSHPNIITVFRSGKADSGELYLVMEYLPGGSLADRLRVHGPVRWEDMLRFGVELSGALGTAHKAGVLHRDVKPGNIMLDGLGRSQLGDFGIARLDGGPETKSSVITASVAHAPPEVIAGDRPDERSDIYSLASTLYELIAGAPAFSRPTDESMIPMFNRIVNEPAPDIRRSGVPDSVATVLERAMAKRADDRHQSAADFGQALVLAQRINGLDETRLWIAGEPENVPQVESATQLVAPPQTGSDSPDLSWPAPAAGRATPPPAPNQAPAATPPPSGPPSQSPAPGIPSPAPGHPVAPQPVAAQPTPVQPTPVQSAPVQPTPAQPFTQAAPPPGGPPSVAQPASSGSGSRAGLWAVYLGAAVVVLGLVVGGIQLLGGDDTEEAGQNLVDGVTDADRSSSDGGTSASGSDDPSTDSGGSDDGTSSGSASGGVATTEAPPTTVTTEPPPTTVTTEAPSRPDYLAGLPRLPAVADPYVEYRTVTDTESAFIVKVPAEWVDDLPTEGQVLASPDNNAALADSVISGVVVSGTEGIGVWDAEFFLNTLLEGLEDPDDPCDEVLREPYDDGLFDGLLYAESCSDGDLLVVDLLVANPDRDAVIFIGVQMTDERDFAAFDRIIDSFVLLDPKLLPDVD